MTPFTSYRRAIEQRGLGIVLLLIAFILTSCVTVRDIPASGANHMIRDVPFYRGADNRCGPVSLAGVLNYWGVRATPEEIARDVFSSSAGGTLNIDMVIYPQKKGLHAEQYSGSMDDIRKNIDRGYPLIVLVDYGFSFFQRNHFMVIVGYNEDGVIVNSGDKKEKMIPLDNFLRTWRRTNFWTLLIKKA